jgi:hypothetical protein
VVLRVILSSHTRFFANFAGAAETESLRSDLNNSTNAEEMRNLKKELYEEKIARVALGKKLAAQETRLAALEKKEKNSDTYLGSMNTDGLGGGFAGGDSANPEAILKLRKELSAGKRHICIMFHSHDHDHQYTPH